MRTSRVQRLRNLGFDESYAIPFERGKTVADLDMECPECGYRGTFEQVLDHDCMAEREEPNNQKLVDILYRNNQKLVDILYRSHR